MGFYHKLTETGKVVKIINPQNVKHERKKLYRMAQLVSKGVITEEKLYDCYTSWKAHAQQGNSWKLIQKMDKYLKDTLKEAYANANRTEEGTHY